MVSESQELRLTRFVHVNSVNAQINRQCSHAALFICSDFLFLPFTVHWIEKASVFVLCKFYTVHAFLEQDTRYQLC